MDKFDFSLRRLIEKRRLERPKHIHKSWVDFGTGARAIIKDLFIVFQLSLLAFLYAFFAYKFRIFFYASLGLTVGAAAHVFLCERDGQVKASWMLLFLVSFGCGYIVYILADKRICYGYDKRRFAEISARAKRYTPEYGLNNASAAVHNDCEYLYNAGGCVPYTDTEISYYSNSRAAMDNLIARIESAEKFVFLEYFIVADGLILDRLLSVFERKSAEGVEIRLLYDDVGCAGVLSADAKKRIKAAGVKLKAFSKLSTIFSFGLNFRDHRKIVVVDGKTGYTGGFNLIDDCANHRKMEGLWKDSGVRLDGAAVDGLTLAFLRMWEFATKEKLDYSDYLGKYEKVENTSHVVPYAGGPELKEAVCRGIYANAVAGARERIYIMTPYFIPDGALYSAIKAKAQSGVDVRLLLPAVPDYSFIYRVTQSNAEKLIKFGVKVYYAQGCFVHSKVMLTENCALVGSVNVDMRAFYQEFDNGVYTDDAGAMNDILADFENMFALNQTAEAVKRNMLSRIITAVLKMVSPLM